MADCMRHAGLVQLVQPASDSEGQPVHSCVRFCTHAAECWPPPLPLAQTLLEVLAARLVDIQEWWAAGALQVCIDTSDSQLHFLSQRIWAERLCRRRFLPQLRLAVVMPARTCCHAAA
jgi:hypothetical protein